MVWNIYGLLLIRLLNFVLTQGPTLTCYIPRRYTVKRDELNLEVLTFDYILHRIRRTSPSLWYIDIHIISCRPQIGRRGD